MGAPNSKVVTPLSVQNHHEQTKKEHNTRWPSASGGPVPLALQPIPTLPSAPEPIPAPPSAPALSMPLSNQSGPKAQKKPVHPRGRPYLGRLSCSRWQGA